MARQVRLLVVLVGGLLAAFGVLFAAHARPGELAPRLPRAASPARPLAAPLAACRDMDAGPVAWVTLTDEGDVDRQVRSYPARTNAITPIFEYACVPPRLILVTVFSHDGRPLFTDKEQLRATDSPGVYGYPLGTNDGSPLAEGEWGVEFYDNKVLMTSGRVLVGAAVDDDAAGELVAVEGVVTDKKSRRPISGAAVLVLQPGVRVSAWIKAGQPDDDVFTGARSDSQGAFILAEPVEREVTYSIVIVARGYKTLATDAFVVRVDQPEPVVLTVKMVK
jgi:hypothetical protein